jgi:7-carboxy-7-deazaguanine synthase
LKLKLAEEFLSIQGEGHLSGKPTYFIRLAGCAVTECVLHPVNSNLCDTDWYPRLTLRSEEFGELADRAREAVGPMGWVTITGGEPLEQATALAQLLPELKKRHLLVNIQTSGARWVTCPWDWLSVSPKSLEPSRLVQNFGQELKVVVLPGTNVAQLKELLDRTRFWNYYVMPLTAADGTTNLDETVALVLAASRQGMPWELTTQAHKVWGLR